MERPDATKVSTEKRRRRWSAKFADSLRGFRFAIEERSFRVHLTVSVIVVGVGVVVRPSVIEWMFLLSVVGLVLVTEIVNTALERMARAIAVEQHPLVGQSLDLASAAVLTASALAVVVGAAIFGPKCLAWLQSFWS
ncbi:MAG: diacylglycerol kinase [Pirellulaceae bacterium]